jgi:phage terminase large subunit-like protein
MTDEPSNIRHQLADALASSWATKARPNQRLPAGDWWSIWLLLSGRGWGKTKTLAETANYWATTGQYTRIGAIAATGLDVRNVLVDGESGIIASSPSWCRAEYHAARRQIEWANGALCNLYSAEEPDRLRGPQHEALLFDELASWRRAQETYDNAMFGLRLGKHPRIIIATTPRPTKLIRELVAREGKDVVISRGTSFENAANLAPQFFDRITAKYAGTRIGRQELSGELLEDVPGALWTVEMLDRSRRERAPELLRIVVAIDPAVSSHEGSDETGIIVAGKDTNGHGYIIEDLSGRYAPNEWAMVSIQAFHRHAADRIVAEVNQGGAMVEATLRTIDPNIPYSAVHASRGKYIRAAPVSALFAQDRVHLVGSFPELEDQLLQFTPDMDRSRSSPDHADAAIWGLTELLIDQEAYAGLLTWYENDAAQTRAKISQPAAPAPAENSPHSADPAPVVYPIYGQHPDEPPFLFPTRNPGGGIRWVPKGG